MKLITKYIKILVYKIVMKEHQIKNVLIVIQDICSIF